MILLIKTLHIVILPTSHLCGYVILIIQSLVVIIIFFFIESLSSLNSTTGQKTRAFHYTIFLYLNFHCHVMHERTRCYLCDALEKDA